jgi:prophage antirepressor-like protein
MTKETAIKLFEDKKIRTHWDEQIEEWYFSVVDVVEILTESSNPRDYWFKMKQRVKLEDEIELSTICRQLKLLAPDGKMRETDCANVQSLLRIIQSIPSPRAEPFKQWLAKVGYERMKETVDPEQSLDRARENWMRLGRRLNFPPGKLQKANRQKVLRKMPKQVKKEAL